MAVYNKFQDFVEQLTRGVHAFATHTFRLALTNTAPTATQVSFDNVTNHPPPAAANGYTTNGPTVTVSAVTETTGTVRPFITDVVYTATAGGIGPFRYVVLYNDTATSPADALVAWWDYGSSITLASGETFTVDFDGANGVFSLT